MRGSNYFIELRSIPFKGRAQWSGPNFLLANISHSIYYRQMITQFQCFTSLIRTFLIFSFISFESLSSDLGIMDPESKIESKNECEFVVTKVPRKALIIRCLIVRCPLEVCHEE